MKALKIIGFVLIGFIAIVVLLGLFAPKDFKVERSILIPASSKEVVFKNISLWSEILKWSPWAEKDPAMKVTFKGTEGQVGANYMWEGNDQVGKGEMTITAIREFEMIESDLHFIEPFETNNKTSYTMTPEGDGYKVSWEMSGSSPFPFNVVGLFMNMDKMVGPDFEKGLSMLKEKCMTESAAAALPPIPAEGSPTDTSKISP